MSKFILFLAFISLCQNSSATGMNVIPKSETDKATKTIQIENFPKTRSSDSISNCYAVVNSYLIDHTLCKAKVGANCAEVSNDEKISVTDYTRYQDYRENDDRESRLDYKGISVDQGGLSYTLANAFRGGGDRKFTKESCVPFDQVLAGLPEGQNLEQIEETIWNKLRKSYDGYQREKECITCGNEYATAVSRDFKESSEFKESAFKLNLNNEEVLKAFAEDSFEKFLEKLLVPTKCKMPTASISVPSNMGAVLYPANNCSPGKANCYNLFLEEVKTQLREGNAIGVQFCAQEPLTVTSMKGCGDSGSGHAVAIRGYREICDSQNKCRHAVQIQNTWGQKWQTDNNDGWIDAKDLLNRTFFEAESMAWIGKK